MCLLTALSSISAPDCDLEQKNLTHLFFFFNWSTLYIEGALFRFVTLVNKWEDTGVTLSHSICCVSCPINFISKLRHEVLEFPF